VDQPRTTPSSQFEVRPFIWRELHQKVGSLQTKVQPMQLAQWPGGRSSYICQDGKSFGHGKNHIH